jgi:hypothetical protein
LGLVIEATFWATLAAASLLVGAGVTFAFHPSRHLVGLVMAFGAGAMISAVAFDLVLEASKEVSFPGLALGMAVGAVTFFAGSRLIRRLGGGAQMMLDFLGEAEAAKAIESAVINVTREKIKSLAAGRMGYSTSQVGDLVAAAL